MSPRKKISDADLALFRNAVTDVKPLPQVAAPPSTTPKKPRRHITDPVKPNHALAFDDVTPVRSGDAMEFARNGISSRMLTQLKRGSGSLIPTATLDLHGLRADSAQIAMNDFLRHCSAMGDRSVRIIHGKGRSANDTAPVLKSIVNHWLREQASVLAFCSAPNNDGGTGAVYVLLKRSPI